MTDSYLMNTYRPLDVSFTHGQGLYLFDNHSKQYFDAIAGIATCSLGHAHPQLSAVISEQAKKLLHCSNLYHIETQEQLAQKLCTITNMDKVFFANSGAEANEAAIKLARKHASQQQLSDAKIIVLEGAFHGRTLATLSASASTNIQHGFEPLVQGFVRAPRNDLSAIQQLFETHNICAILLEPTQGEGGIYLLQNDYLKSLEGLCKQHNALLMFDEIQTGNGRTGSYFAYQQLDVLPDVVTTAKGLGNGFPIGACLTQGKAATLFEPGNHGSTFGGNPLACATALCVVNTIEQQQLCANAKTIGAYLLAQLQQRLGQLPHVVEIRGHGLMIGIELTAPCSELVSQALSQGLLINVTAATVVRLLPALIITAHQADELLDKLCPLIENFSITQTP